MAHKPEHKEVIDSIIDQEIETAGFVRDIVEKLPGSLPVERMKVLARRVVALRRENKITLARARVILDEGFRVLMSFVYTQHVHSIKELVDKHVEAQVAAINRLQRPLSELSPIRNSDIKARELEKAGAVNEQGVLISGEEVA